MNRPGPVALLVLLIASTALPLAAQTAQITGRVVDSSGGVITGAKVSVRNIETGVARSVDTNDQGYYAAPLLTRGQYEVIAEMTGFRSARQTGVTLDEGQILRADFTLEVGQVSERVEVSASAPLLQTEDTSLSAVVTNKSVVDLPLVGRNPLALAALQAGVRATGRFGDLPVSSFDGSRASIAGGPPSANNYMVDGVAAENFTSGGMNVTLSVDATEEFRVITKNPSAEYGRTAGGVINVISKSGSNQFHGTAYEFHRNKVLNANDFFSNRANRARAPFVFNQYGLAGGGPIRKDKTFFYANWERFHQRTLERAFRTVPTDLQRQGDFSQTFAAAGQPIMIYDPATTRPDPANPANRIRDPFPGNVIPANRISPAARAILNYYPRANDPGAPITQANNFFGQASAPLDKDMWGVRIDHYLTPTRRIFGRYTWDDTFRGSANYYDNVSEINTSDLIFRRRSYVFNYSDSLRPNLLFEARAGLNRYAPDRPTRSLGFDVTQIGLPGYINTAVPIPTFPRFNITDLTAIGADQGDHLIQGNNAWTAASNATWIRGAQTIKFGAEYRVYQLNNSQNSSLLDFSFARNFTRGPNPNNTAINSGHGLATFLLGTPTGGTARIGPFTTYTAKSLGLFIQDDWKITPRLTLNLGVRWEFEGALTDRYNAISNFDPEASYTIRGVPFRGGTVYPGEGGLPRGYRDNWFNLFGPRFGFAWQALSNTVIRGGYGLYYAPTTGNFVRIGQSGFSQNNVMVTSLDGGFTPANTLANPYPDGVTRPLNAAAGPGAALGTSAEGNVRSMSVPYAHQWNFNVQRQFRGNWLLEVGYAGNRGVHLPGPREYDYLPQQFVELGTQLQQQVPNPYFGIITTGNLSAPQVQRGALLDTFPQFTGAGTIDHWASSIYHALMVRGEKRFSGGLSVLVSYAFTKTIDDNGGNGLNGFFNGGNNGVQNWNDLRAERAVSTINLPHRLVITPLWALPFGQNGNRFVRSVFGGWQIGGILTTQSGEPIGITQNAVPFGGNRPNVVGDPNDISNRSIDRWFNTDAFQVIPAFTFGNAPRNLPRTRTDSLFNLDFSVLKDIPLTERFRLQLRGEAFNVTNTVTFGNPGTNRSATNFGVVAGYATNYDPRRIQLAAKVIF
jgi:outer membrane receptor protein involved in Fe transport